MTRKRLVSLETVLGALFLSVPVTLRPKIYKQLTLALHPDRGGETELMQSLNNAWERHRVPLRKSSSGYQGGVNAMMRPTKPRWRY